MLLVICGTILLHILWKTVQYAENCGNQLGRICETPNVYAAPGTPPLDIDTHVENCPDFAFCP
jgi:hypothetical protein